MKSNIFMKRALYSVRTLFILGVGLACLWVISTLLNFRVDLTQERFFTLSSGSQRLVEKLPDDVTIKFYFSRSAKNIPPPIKAYATRVEDLLRQYANQSKGKITLETLDPRPDTDADNWARRYGLKPVPLADGAEMFFGLAVFAGKKEAVLSYIDPRREQFLEYDVSEALQKLINKERPRVGILSGLELIAKKPVQDMQSLLQGKGDWVLISELRKVSAVEEIPTDVKKIPEQINILVVHHPKSFSEDVLRAIDQFVMRGGKLIALVDPFSRFELDKQFQEGNVSGSNSSDLRQLFTAWDIEFDPLKITGDLKHPTQINAGGVPVVYPLFVQVPEKGLSKESMITSQLRQMMFGEAGSLALRSGSPHRFDPLVSTSASAGWVPSDAPRSGPESAARRLSSDGREYVVAAMLRGKLKSAFSPSSSDPGWLSQTKEETAVVLVADSDFVADSNSVQKFAFGNQIVARPVNDNLNFIVNAVDFLGGSEDLIGIRSRTKFSRPFERLVDIREKAQAKWKSEEDSLQSRLAQAQAKLNEMQGAKLEGNKLVLTREQQSEIERFRAEEAQMRTRLREVRKNLREDIESLGRTLVVLNMAVVPVGVSLAGGFVFYRRSRKKSKGK